METLSPATTSAGIDLNHLPIDLKTDDDTRKISGQS